MVVRKRQMISMTRSDIQLYQRSRPHGNHASHLAQPGMPFESQKLCINHLLVAFIRMLLSSVQRRKLVPDYPIHPRTRSIQPRISPTLIVKRKCTLDTLDTLYALASPLHHAYLMLPPQRQSVSAQEPSVFSLMNESTGSVAPAYLPLPSRRHRAAIASVRIVVARPHHRKDALRGWSRGV